MCAHVGCLSHYFMHHVYGSFFLNWTLCRVHAVCVCDDAKYFYSHVDEQLQAYGITHSSEGKPVWARDIVDIIDGYKGEGYGKATEEEMGELMCVQSHV